MTQGLDTDLQNPASRFLLHVLGAAAEFEKTLTRERAHAGRMRYRKDYLAGKVGWHGEAPVLIFVSWILLDRHVQDYYDNRRRLSMSIKEPIQPIRSSANWGNPAFRKIVSPNEYASLGDDFEKKEHERFREDGFQKNVDEVARTEKVLGIYDLAQFTPSE